MARTLLPLSIPTMALFAGLALSPCALAQQLSTNTRPPNIRPAPAALGGPVSNTEGSLPPALDAVKPAAHDGPVVQVALLLDTSNSMDGLIDQARAELWTVINTLRGLRHETGDVQFQVALYQYGNDSLESSDGFVQLRAPFTTDLDVVSEQLFALSTNGGSEYCGWVINDAAEELEWIEPTNDEDAAPALRMIVIAGNEPFSQGSVSYSSSIPNATGKGVRVHTVHCGDDQTGIAGYWQDGASIGEGFYFSIDQDKSVRFATQYDDAILLGNTRLNSTYYNFELQGQRFLSLQSEVDADNEEASTEQMVQRAAAKSSAFYENSHWDLVDAWVADSIEFEDIEQEALPEELQGLSEDELEKKIEEKIEERKQIQKEITELYRKRELEIAEQREEMGVVTLGVALSQAIIEQAREEGFTHVDDEVIEEEAAPTPEPETEPQPTPEPPVEPTPELPEEL